MAPRFLAVLLAAVVGLTATAGSAQVVSQGVVFARDIQPLLAKHCVLCHGPDEAEAGLRLDVRSSALLELESGCRALVPGNPDESEVMRRVTTSDSSLQMPPDGEPLADEAIAQLRRWILDGAMYQLHWAYRPVSPPAVPPEPDGRRKDSPIDRFILARLEQDRIAPSPQADPEVLVKRLFYDLIGLPPTPQEVDAFVTDQAADAYPRLVDRLLSSPHFGERWGRHWLDKARYADSDGYEKDRPRPNAWRYRDWVIDAINRDMPFDQFTIEQLAGDLLPHASPMQKLATAFHRQTLTNTEGGVDQEEFRVEATFDRTETTAAVWMGLTMNCARCHSHKYDQISQHEYYRLFAFFNNADEASVDIAPREHEPDGDREADKVRIMTSAKRTTRVLHRGDFLQPADEVRPGALATVTRTHALLPRRAATSASDDPAAICDRLDLARWLAHPQHPLTSRVAVNHVWTHLFGRGLVPTVNDFGVRGEPPTHPGLLDWLAWEFPRSMNWSRKRLIKAIVTSRTYRQSSRHRPELRTIDPSNRLLARQNRLRVEAEVVRDLHLAAAGLLSTKVGGPSVFPPLPPGVAELSYANNFKWKTSQGEDRYRRGMYTFFKRTSPHPTLISFDCPDSNTTRLHRDRSNTPLQALVTLNNAVFAQAAQEMANRVLDETEDDDSQRLTYALRLCIARPPGPEEIEPLRQLLVAAREHYRVHPDEADQLIAGHARGGVSAVENAAWIATVRVILNLDEFLVRD